MNKNINEIILINPDYMMFGDPPLGLAYIAAYIKKHVDIKISIYDQMTNDDIINSLSKKKQEEVIVGITAVTNNWFRVKLLAKQIKDNFPNILLIIGGVHITTSPKSFQSSPFDIAVIGEGEFTMVSLLSALSNNQDLSSVQGLIFRKEDAIISTGRSPLIKILDDIPLPARELLNMNYYTLPRFSSDKIDPVGSLLTSRGCPYSCRFCSSSLFWGRNIRYFSAERVIEEIKLLNEQYGYMSIVIYDDLFAVNKERLRKIVQLMKESGLDKKGIKFNVLGRANCFDEETILLLLEMGVTCIEFGFETGSQRMLTYLKREGVTIENGVNAIKLCQKYKMNYGGFFMLGSPTETKEDIEETKKFIMNYCKDGLAVMQTKALPGTEIWNYGIENGIIKEEEYEDPISDYIECNPDKLLSKDISKEDFKKEFEDIKSIQKHNYKIGLLSLLTQIRFRHLKSLFSKEFIKKAYNLRGSLFKKLKTTKPKDLNTSETKI